MKDVIAAADSLKCIDLRAKFEQFALDGLDNKGAPSKEEVEQLLLQNEDLREKLVRAKNLVRECQEQIFFLDVRLRLRFPC